MRTFSTYDYTLVCATRQTELLRSTHGHHFSTHVTICGSICAITPITPPSRVSLTSPCCDCVPLPHHIRPPPSSTSLLHFCADIASVHLLCQLLLCHSCRLHVPSFSPSVLTHTLQVSRTTLHTVSAQYRNVHGWCMLVSGKICTCDAYPYFVKKYERFMIMHV